MKKTLLVALVLLVVSCKKNSELKKSINSSKENINLISKKDSLAIQLIELYGSDQIARRNHRMFTALDSINFYRLVQFIEDYGYPNEDLLGEKYMDIESITGAPVAILLHNPHILVNEKKYLNFFLNEVEKGNMNRNSLATVLDKYYWVRRDKFGNRKLLYGSEFGKPCKMYRKQSDSVRAIIGLKPLPETSFINCNP